MARTTAKISEPDKSAPENSPDVAPSQPARDGTLSWRIIRQIRAMLFAGELKTGERLGGEIELARRYGVSRMAIRDALRSLEAAGIVEIRVGAKGGTYIAGGNIERFADALAIQLKLIGVTVAEIFDAQIAIEVTSTELAALRADESDLRGLRDILRGQREHRQSKTQFTDLSLRFHESVVAASHNRALIAQFKALRFVLEPLYARWLNDDVAARVIASNTALLARIEARDAEGARALMHRRLQIIRARQLTAAENDRATAEPA
ncbi:MAG TPA: FCD domain-containing protein [Stellaceae bacterium]|jgi:DNA-binding FadR family transcriptional regulator|nr:FCD domain-containing protein [Stellaceae bacterium]